MKSNQLRTLVAVESAGFAGSTLRVGRFIGQDLQGRPVVDYPGNTLGPVVARALDGAAHGKEARRSSGDEVVLLFETVAGSAPIILGFVRQVLAVPNHPVACDSQNNVTVRGKALQFDADECMTLRCGKSSIVLYADGRIVLKGTRLLSRASEVNKIKGAVVAVN